MDIRVTLDLRPKSLHEEIPVFVEIREEEGALIFTENGTLPANRALFRQLDQWRSSYGGLAGPYREIKLKSAQIGGSIQSQKEACTQSAESLQQQFQVWLQAPSFQPIANGLREYLHHENEIRIFLRTDCFELRQLPWQDWDLLGSYSRAEIVLSNPTAKRLPADLLTHKHTHSQVEILAVVGNSDRLDTEVDLQDLQTFSPDAHVCYLPQPSEEELFNKLWEKPWDIFFFAGHSKTEGKQGIICLNETEELPIARLSEALKTAIQKGLAIAIFNSCDGLGLAQDLEKLHIPNLIVMREPVPDAIAQLFLKNLLSAYSQDMPLHRAVRDARKKLAIKEREYPCASSLPILCQNPTTPSPTWSQIRTGSRTGGRIGGDRFKEIKINNQQTQARKLSHSGTKLNRKTRILVVCLIACLSTCLVFLLRTQGLLESQELYAYDRLIQARPLEQPDNRLLLITVDDEDFEYQKSLGLAPEGHLSNLVLGKLLEKLERFKPRTIGIGILRSGELDLSFEQNKDRIFFSCEIPYTRDNNEETYGASPPSQISLSNIGFSNFVFDQQDVIRRQPLILDNKGLQSSCTSQSSFSFQLALDYLSKQEGVEFKPQTVVPEVFINTSNELSIIWELGKTVQLKRLSSSSGGYQYANKKNYQILLNYRSLENLEAVAESIALKDILEDRITDSAIQKLQDRLIIIGGVIPSSSASFDTPFPDELKGLTLYAHMSSQIISAVLDGRRLIWWWPDWLEYLWIFGWSLLGACLAMWIKRPLYLGVAITMALAILSLFSQIAITQAGWIPFVPPALALILTPAILTFLLCRKIEVT